MLQAGNRWCGAAWMELGKDLIPSLSSAGYVSSVQIKENAASFSICIGHQSNHIVFYGSEPRPRR